MNLLIEQRPTTLTSPKPQTSSSSSQQQQSQISNENDMNNSSSSSSLVLKIKRHSTKQQQNNDLHSNSSHMSEEDNQNNNSPTSRLKRTSISNTISTRRPSSPAFNGKQQQQQQNSAKRSITTDNNNNDLTSNLDEISSTKRFKREDLNQSSSLRKVDACVETVSVGLATEPDQLGPCEPGTSVVLEGIVWNETDSGVLVVNVTWRGKTYVGTLLDSTKQDWACPRLTCESPTSDYDARGGSKTSRSKRTGAGGNTRSSTQQNISLCQQVISNNHLAGIDERRLRNNIKSRQSKRLNNLPSTTTNDETPINSPPPRTTPTTNQTFFPSETSTSEPHLISCSEHQCHKRFTSTTALTYHLSNAHKQTESSPISTSTTVPQPSTTRDEEDVAHILANVADYVRRSSPPSSIRCSPEHQHSPPITTTTIKPLENSSTLTWPCPQISSNLVLPSSLNQVLSPDSTNRCKLNNNECNSIEQNDLKNSAKPADHFLLHIKDEPIVNKSTTISSPTYQDLNNSKITSPVPPPPSTLSASSPAYSDISDEEPTTTTTTEPVLPPSTVNLLTATNGKIDENGNNLHSSSSSSSSIPTSSDLTNPAWTAQMLLQQFGPFIQQQQTLVTDISSTPNRLNSNNTCPSSNGTSDSTVKNILDTRRSSTTKSSSSPPTNLYPFHSNESKFPTPIINTLTSPNENLLHLSTLTIKPMDVIDYSLNNTRSSNAGQYHHSSSLHPSR